MVLYSLNTVPLTIAKTSIVRKEGGCRAHCQQCKYGQSVEISIDHTSPTHCSTSSLNTMLILTQEFVYEGLCDLTMRRHNSYDFSKSEPEVITMIENHVIFQFLENHFRKSCHDVVLPNIDG